MRLPAGNEILRSFTADDNGTFGGATVLPTCMGTFAYCVSLPCRVRLEGVPSAPKRPGYRLFAFRRNADRLAPMPAPRVVKLTGEIDVYTARTACRVLDDIAGPAVIDLSGVRLLCAEGLRELANVAARAGAGVVTLRGAPPHVRRVLEIARFGQLFTIEA